MHKIIEFIFCAPQEILFSSAHVQRCFHRPGRILTRAANTPNPTRSTRAASGAPPHPDRPPIRCSPTVKISKAFNCLLTELGKAMALARGVGNITEI